MSEKLLVPPREAARLLSISPRKLWDLTAAAEIPCVRIERSVRYSVSELQLWIQQKGNQDGKK